MNILPFSVNFFVKRRFFFWVVITGSLLFLAALTSCSPHAQNRRRIPEARETKTADEIITQMKGRLNLTEDEEVKVRPIIEEQVKRRKEIIKKYEGQGYKGMDPLKDELKDLRISTASQLQYFLTSDQMIKYGAMQQEEDQRITEQKVQTQPGEETQQPRQGRGRRSGTF